MDREKREVAGWWFFLLGLFVAAAVALAALSYLGLFTQTAVERAVFEHSYQYQAGKKEALRIYRSQLAEINARLSDPNLDPQTRKNLEAQAARLRVLINAK